MLTINLHQYRTESGTADLTRALQVDHAESQKLAVYHALDILRAIAALSPAMVDPRNDWAVAQARAAVAAVDAL